MDLNEAAPLHAAAPRLCVLAHVWHSCIQIHASLVSSASHSTCSLLPAPTLAPQLVDLLRFYLSFPIHDHTGDPLSEDEVTASHYERVQQLQRLFFKHVPKLRELALANCGTGGWAD